MKKLAKLTIARVLHFEMLKYKIEWRYKVNDALH